MLADPAVERFRVVDCRQCGGLLKPDVVFFGENVPRPRVDDCYALVERAGALVVLGSSLTVMSGYRFVRQAAKLQIPVVIINQGQTRGDAQAIATIDAPLGPALTPWCSGSAVRKTQEEHERDAHDQARRPDRLGPGPRLHGDERVVRRERLDESIATIRRALDLGVTFLDTADVYGAATTRCSSAGASPGGARRSSGP